MKTDVPLLPRAWLIVGLLWFVACLNVMARTMITTMHGSLVAAIPMSEAQFGLLMSAFMCVYGVMSPFAGFLSDRFGRARVILIAMAIWSIVTWLTSFATTYPELLVMRVLMALSEVCYIPAGVAMIADYHRGPTRGLATGIHATALVAGGMFASVGGWLAERHGWSYAFVAVSLPSLAYCFALSFILRDPPREESDAGAAHPGQVAFGPALASLFGRGSFILFLGCVACLDGCNGILIGWLPTYMAEHFHLAQGVAGFSATGYIAVAGVLGMLFAGAWADRWSRTNARSRVFVPIIGLCVATPGVVLAAETHLLPVAIGGLIVIGFFRGFWGSNLMPLLCLVSDPRYRATAFGLVNTASVFIGGLVIYFVGVLRDRHVNFSIIFNFMAVGQVVAIALLLLIKLGRPARLRELRPVAST
jgi:MFS family permease